MSFLSINAYAPVIRQDVDSFQERLQTAQESYSLSVERGFDKASLMLFGSADYLKSWFRNGLVRDVVWKGPDNRICFRGYVNRLAYTVGGFTRTWGVEAMINRIFYVYDRLDASANPPASNGQTTITANDVFSQSLWGLKTKVISGGEGTSTEADSEAESVLAENSRPQVGETQTVESKAPSLKVELKGYSYMLDWYIYSQTASSGTANASTVVAAVGAADPNGVISTDTSLIEENTTATLRYWEKKSAWKVLDTITKRGRKVGGVGEPWISGVYEKRRLLFKAAEGLDSNGLPKSSNQQQRLFRQVYDAAAIYVNEAGAEIPYWHLRPDRLVYGAGLSGASPLYVVKVQFTPPAKVQLAGNDLQNPLRGMIRV